MRRYTPFILGFIAAITSCSTPTPESLAEQTCDCYKEAKSKSNPSNQINETVKCNNMMMQNLSVLDDIGKSKDWNQEQIHQARQRFDNIFENCNK